MIRILLNASAIWAISLLVYELFLRQLSFHRLNRWYILLTFLMGLVLPLLPWGNSVNIQHLDGGGENSAALVMPAPSNSSTGAAATVTAVLPRVNWWLVLYLAGSLVSVVRVGLELFRIRQLYRRAAVRRLGDWRIAETAGAHSPFSFLNIIFISDSADFTPEQRHMILAHEQQHFRSRHYLDLALFQLAAILLWFQPLVYLYRSRLRLVHEYEVDSLQSGDIRTYGRFLLEQAACRPTAMTMTHSFNFSPLKNRIRMLTKRSDNPWAKARFLLLLPMMSCFVWACTKNRPNVEVDIKDRTVARHDAKLSFPDATPADTVTMQNPTTGSWDTVVFTRVPVPSMLDNQPIQPRAALGLTPHCLNPGETFSMNYLLKAAQLEPTLAKMADGDYFMGISDVIIDNSGRVVYYVMTLPENHSNMKTDANGFNIAQPNGLTAADREAVQRKISEKLIAGDVAFTAVKDAGGKPVPYYLDDDRGEPAYKLGATFSVKDHKLSFN